MQTNIKLNPQDFLLVHKLLYEIGIIKGYEDKTLRVLAERGVGYFYIREGGNTGWDMVNRLGFKEIHIDLTNVAIPTTHTIVLDGEEVEVTETAYNQIKEFISCE